MRNERLAGLLQRLLPPFAREWFLPAWNDLRIAGTAGALRTLLLFLDCWRLVLAEVPRRILDRGSRSSSPPPERFTVFLYHVRHAFRRLRREPGFTAAAVLTLALGVSANVAVFTVVEVVLLRPLPYERAEELVVLRHRDAGTGITKEFIAIGDYVDLAARQSVFQTLGGYGVAQATIYGEGDPFQVPALGATPALLQALGFRPLLGRSLTPDDALPGAGPVVLLGHELWRTRFGGDSSIIGRHLQLAGGQRLVVGIAPPGFRFPPNAGTGVILSITLPSETPAVRKGGWTFALARLKPGRTVADATTELAALSRQLEQEFPADNRGSAYYAVPLRDETVGDAKRALLLLLGAVSVVLLIACANVTNLLLARSLSHRRELVVRMTLGAGRGRLVGQLLVESLVLATVAGTAGLLLAGLGAEALLTLVPDSLIPAGTVEVGLNLTVLGFALGLTLLTALGIGVVSALTTPLANGAGLLVVAGRASMSPAARRATAMLVAAEMAFAVALLIGAGLILRSFAGLLAVDPGFQGDQVLTVQIGLPAARYQAPEAREAFYGQAFPALRANPDVAEVGAAVVVPLTGNNWTAPFERVDQPVPPGERPPEVGWQVASGGYFRTLRIPLRSGRLFDERDRTGGPPVVIISEAVQQRFFPGDSAVGHRIRLTPDESAEIVGVVGDIRRAGLTDEPRADLYFPFERNPSAGITLFLRTRGDPEQAFGSVHRTLRTVEPDVALLETRSMAQVAGESVRVTRLVLWLLGIFAAVALGLAAVGIYGVMSYAVRQRTREIGTRIALGASRPDILWLVMRQGLRIAGAGALIGLAVGLGAARALRSMLFGVTAADPLVLAGSAGVLVATALLACYVPALRATSVDPVRSLADN